MKLEVRNLDIATLAVGVVILFCLGYFIEPKLDKLLKNQEKIAKRLDIYLEKD